MKIDKKLLFDDRLHFDFDILEKEEPEEVNGLYFEYKTVDGTGMDEATEFKASTKLGDYSVRIYPNLEYRPDNPVQTFVAENNHSKVLIYRRQYYASIYYNGGVLDLCQRKIITKHKPHSSCGHHPYYDALFAMLS